ncbi:MAG: ABC transporter permease [Actinomycetota bacterium]
MLRYLIRRIVAFIAIMLTISLLSFWLMRLLPGDPIVKHLGTSYTPENAAQFAHQVGLDKGFFAQYFSWLGHALTGDLGYSWNVSPNSPITTIMSKTLPPTIEIAVLSQIIALFISIPMSVAVVRRPNGRFDRGVNAVMLSAYSIPTLIAIPILTLILTVRYSLLPGPSSWISFAEDPWLNLKVCLLPAIAISIASIAGHFRFLRNDMIINLQEDFVVMARSKGLTNRRILWRHVLRPSSVTLLTSVGLTIGGLIVGLFVAEVYLAIPGFSTQVIAAVDTSDYALLQACIMTIAFIVISIQLIVNFLLPIIDPRIARD